jgi:hypothetical protein
MEVRIKERSWLAFLASRKLKANKVAIVWGRTIHLHNTTREEFLSNPRWVKHERAHIDQYRRYGTLRFLFLYLWYSIRFGYYNNPLEVEARAKEKEPHC